MPLRAASRLLTAAALLFAAATGCGRSVPLAEPAGERPRQPAHGVAEARQPAIGGASERLFPPDVPFFRRASWGAADPVLPLRPHVPTRITIHHTATRIDTVRPLTEKLQALQRFSQSESPLAGGRVKPAWADVPYHYYIDPAGAVAEARDPSYAGDSNTPYDPAGHLLIVVEGNFEVDRLTDAQQRALEAVVPALAGRWGIAGDRIAGHRDFAATACPGKQLYDFIPRLREVVSRGGY
jgi:hypothetical protein